MTIELKKIKGVEFQYDTKKKKYLNPETGKWVVRPQNTAKTVKSEHVLYSQPEVDQILTKLFPNRIMRESVASFLYLIYNAQIMHAAYQDEKLKLQEDCTDLELCSHRWVEREIIRNLLGDAKIDAVLIKLENAGIITVTISEPIPRNFGLIRFQYYSLAKSSYFSNVCIKHVTLHRVDQKLNTIAANRKSSIAESLNEIDFSSVPFTDKTTSTLKYRLHDVIDSISKTIKIINLDEDSLRKVLHARFDKKIQCNAKEETQRHTYVDMQIRRILPVIRLWNNTNASMRYDKFTVCDFGKRLHFPMTYLISDARQYLWNEHGLDFVEFDLANAQPTLLAAIMNKENCIDEAFTQDVENNCIYENISQRMNISRGEAKIYFLQMMYCNFFSKMNAQFENLYPNAYAFSKACKLIPSTKQGNHIPYLKRYKNLPMILQQSESKIFRALWYYLLDHNIRFFPVHDAVYVVRDDIQDLAFLRNELQSIIRGYIHIKFMLKETDIDYRGGNLPI